MVGALNLLSAGSAQAFVDSLPVGWIRHHQCSELLLTQPTSTPSSQCMGNCCRLDCDAVWLAHSISCQQCQRRPLLIHCVWDGSTTTNAANLYWPNQRPRPSSQCKWLPHHVLISLLLSIESSASTTPFNRLRYLDQPSSRSRAYTMATATTSLLPVSKVVPIDSYELLHSFCISFIYSVYQNLGYSQTHAPTHQTPSHPPP